MAKPAPIDEIAAALRAKPRNGGSELSESDYKRKLVAEVNRMPGGYARRIEDRFAVGVLDLIVKLPDRPIVFAEGKLIKGFLFGPTERQYAEGVRLDKAGVRSVLLGWKQGQMYVSKWVVLADCRECFTAPEKTDAEALLHYLNWNWGAYERS